jgi:multiple sugar transport system permease protein
MTAATLQPRGTRIRGHSGNVRGRRGPMSVLAYATVVIYALLMLLPLYYAVISAFKTNEEIFSGPLTPEMTTGFANFRTAQRSVNMVKGIVNSFLVTIGTEVVLLTVAVLAAFGIARTKSRLSGVAEKIFGLGFLIPTFAVLVPTYLMAVRSHLIDRPLVFLVLFYAAAGLPLSVLLLAQFMRTVPSELEEAATIDGASRMRILWHVIIPMVKPGIVTVAILNFLGVWNEYLFASVIATEDARTVQVALPFLSDFRGTNLGLVAAGIVITLLPVYAVYAVLHRRMQEALVAGAIKG